MSEVIQTTENEQDLSELLRIRREKLFSLQQEGKDPFAITKFDVSHHSTDVVSNFESLDGKDVTVAGRMMVKRVMGKASFMKLQDREGTIQCYVARDAVGEEAYAEFKKMDIEFIFAEDSKALKHKSGWWSDFKHGL